MNPTEKYIWKFFKLLDLKVKMMKRDWSFVHGFPNVKGICCFLRNALSCANFNIQGVPKVLGIFASFCIETNGPQEHTICPQTNLGRIWHLFHNFGTGRPIYKLKPVLESPLATLSLKYNIISILKELTEIQPFKNNS